jgi:hypothetical protein
MPVPCSDCIKAKREDKCQCRCRDDKLRHGVMCPERGGDFKPVPFVHQASIQAGYLAGRAEAAALVEKMADVLRGGCEYGAVMAVLKEYEEFKRQIP